MASGSFNVSTSNQYISGYVSWSSTPNTEGNYSTVTMTLYMSRNNTGYTTYRIPRITFTIEGQSWYYDAGSNQTFTYNSNTYCGSYTRDVPHNADGSLVCSLNVSGTLYSSSGSYTVNSTSDSVTLDTIPRASSPTLSGTGVMGTVLTIYTNKLASFTHTIRYSFSSLSGTIATGVVDSCTWTIPINFANQIPNATSGYGTIYCDTYSGGTLIGTKTVGFVAWLPDSIVPSFTSITGAELNTSVSTIVGKYVQRLSNIRLTINGAVGAYGSSITAYNINYNGVNYGASTIDTGAIGWSGNLTVIATITDSRGRTAQKTLTLNALAYNYPSITGFSVARYSDSAGTTANDMGTYAKITTVATVSSLINSTEKNTLTYTLYSKARTTSTWTTIKTATTISGLSLNTANTLGIYTATSSFDFRVDVTDKFNTTMSLTVLPTGLVCMSWSQNGLGVGKVHENGTLDVNGDIYESGSKLADKYAGKYNISSRGNVTAETGTALPSVSGLSMSQVYSNGYPISYGNVITLNGVGKGELLIGWSGTSGSHADNFIRSKRDTADAPWSPWAKLWTEANLNPSNYAPLGNFSGSNSQNGYRWVNGMMFSWGYYGSQWLPVGWNTFNFHNAFPNGCFLVLASCNYSGSGTYLPTTRPKSNTQFEIYQPADIPSGGGTITEIWYFAVGY